MVSPACSPNGPNRPNPEFAWLSLEDSDNGLNQFFAYVIAAIQTLKPDFGSAALTLLESPPPVPTEPILTLLLNAIAALPDRIVLVLDDYHLIQAAGVHDVLTFLLEHLTPQLHVVFATREDPPLPIPRLRARAELTELRAEDLRFSPTEATQFLNSSMSLSLSDKQIELLEQRTEGWITGLQLAALALQNQPDNAEAAAQFLESFGGGNRFVLDYVVAEVLERQPDHVRQFLLLTSILDRLSGPLCDALFSRANDSSQHLLESLELSDLLIVPLDGHRTWFRYHHLFAEVLRDRLSKVMPERIPELHLAASAWFEAQDQLEPAIHHRLAAHDFEQAANLIEMNWSQVRRNCFHSPARLGWAQALPDAVLACRPILSVGLSWELLQIDELEAAAQQMASAERWLAPENASDSADQQMIVVNEAEFPLLPATLANARALHAQAQGDMAQTQRLARRALALIGDTDPFTRGIAGSLLGLAAWTQGDIHTAYSAISESVSNLQQAGNIIFAFSGTFFWRIFLRLKDGCTMQKALTMTRWRSPPHKVSRFSKG